MYNSKPWNNCENYRPLVSEDLQKNRRKRFEIQRIAATILGVDAQQQMKKNSKHHESDVHRVCGCMWTALADNVELMLSKQFKTAHVKNVMTCGSVWSCPVCTAKIQERRREEIAKAMNQWYAEDGQVIMVTLTAPHYNNQSLSELRSMQTEALKQLRKSSGSYIRFLKQNQGFEGLIRALEVTVSRRNGWHLHTHELWFVKADADIKRIKNRTLKRWEDACYRAGLLNPFDEKQVTAFRRRSVDIKGAMSSSDYLAKMDDSKHWGADREMAKQSTKKGKNKGFHPFGLLSEVKNNGKDSAWCKVHFSEYANGMKGARQLFWSSGLKARFEINEKTDEEISGEETETLKKVKSIHKTVWYQLIKSGARASLYDVIEMNNSGILNTFLQGFEDKPIPMLNQ